MFVPIHIEYLLSVITQKWLHCSAFVGSFIYDLAGLATAGYFKQGVSFFSGQKRLRVRQGLNEMNSENFS